jgi:eukaryotic-like serine/threonine-protein kinase
MSSDDAEPASDPASQRIGTVVDRYTIVRLLGQGGMGSVFEARHATLARRFAIKFLLPALATNRDVLRRFENEAKAAGGLEHPNLVAVTDFGRAADGAPYLVMEFLEGSDCAALLHREGQLPIARAVGIVVQACRGLAVAHKAGIVHRDLKPENLFLCDAGDGRDLVKVLDFGIAKLRPADAGLTTGTGTTFGTAYYMSPEQARGAGDIDQRADVWSLGVVLYELLAGRRPFEGAQFLHVIHEILTAEPAPLGDMRPDLPAGLVMAVSRAMTKNPAQRSPSVQVWADSLAPFIETRSGSPKPATPQASATAKTMATPPTYAGQAAGAAPALPAHRSGVARWVVGLSAVAVIAAVVWLGARRPAAPPPAVSAPAIAPAATAKESVAAVLPASPVPIAPRPDASAVSPRPNTSEHPADRPIKRPGPAKLGSRASKKSSARGDKPAEAETPVGHQPIDIERDNPYGR